MTDLGIVAPPVGAFTARPSWVAAPQSLRRGVCEALGSDEVDSVDVHGGMSPGPAAVLSLADGRRVFVKAVSAAVGAGSHELYGWEAVALEAMSLGVPAPELLAVVLDGDWLALVTSWVPGATAGPPWTSAAFASVLDACDRVAEHRAPAAVPPVIDRLPDLDGWAKLATASDGIVDEWDSRHARRLAELVEGWRDWTAGPWLSHHDVRCDNAIIDSHTGRATLVDWSYASAGPSWLDRALLSADVMGSGHEHGVVMALNDAMSALASAPDAASRFVIGLAGMWRCNSTLPPHPGLPTHRAWQSARAAALRPLVSELMTRLS